MKTRLVARVWISLTIISFSPSVAQDGAKNGADLLVMVNASAAIDSMSDTELSQALRGGDSRFRSIGLQKQHYERILQEFAKTNSGNFEREWFALIMTGKRKTKPVVTGNLSALIALAAKSKDALTVMNWQDTGKTPAEHGLKSLKIFKNKK
jgi:hypothetical protein